MKLLVTNDGVVAENECFSTSFDVDNTVYEVLRVIDGIPLFVEDHYLRLSNSLRLQGYNYQISLSEFKKNIETLILENNQAIGNVKFVCFVSKDEIKWVYYFIPHSYPTSEDYKSGITTDLLFAERNNPNAKVVQAELRTKANQLMSETKLYEVLLVNQDGLITEGSRSNVFFVKSEKFYTAPTSMVLEGVTRQKVIQCIKKLNLKVKEHAVSFHFLSDFDAAFISGTSPKVLPIRFIGNQQFNICNEVVVQVMNEYNALIHSYISKQL